ncbi:TetR family transcriptional regulator [Streptomyces sp. TRM 70351]|uniref:TetR/AcrR family transcriptional regulator n=1 Tax=Streptomyces sp. TRM 70351 TaxID=3116552 RepID=UPI002E7B3C98|nr:TetR family transcriptional regulator [Streptomyces sp. TRM 70351]MEE1931088.1 TetR family transcriptional regulator [Streptomyces sp. TRM 70351]
MSAPRGVEGAGGVTEDGVTGRKRTGRRPGITLSRQAILQAAQARFAEYGYEGASIRGIAQDAGVDAALIHHFFLSKEGLFAASIHDALHPEAVVEAVLSVKSVRGTGERLLRTFLGLWEAEQTGRQMRSILRSAVSHEAAARMLREFITQEVLVPVAEATGKTHPGVRASLAASQLVGLAMTRYIVAVEPLAGMDRDDVVAAVAPTLQRYLTGALPEPFDR